VDVTLPGADFLATVAGFEQDIHDELGDSDIVGQRADCHELVELGDFYLVSHQVMLFTPG
jgi:hypothetical protein